MELLSTILSEDANNLSEEQQMLWFARLLKWLQRPRSHDEKFQRWETIYTLRLKFLLQQLNKSPEWKQNFIRLFNSVLFKMFEPFRLVVTGMPAETGFIQDFINRLQEKLLPNTPTESDIGNLIADIFEDKQEILLIDSINEDVLNEFVQMLSQDKSIGVILRTKLLEALRILSIQMLEGALSIRIRLGIAETNRFTFPEFELEENVFYNLIQNSDQSLEAIWKQLADIQSMTDLLFEQMKASGVRTEIVYSFQVHRKRQKRFRMILNLLDTNQSIMSGIKIFASGLIADVHQQRGLLRFLRSNLSLLSKQVIESNSLIGEHYIARTWYDFKHMLISAMGGGFITAGTVFIKYAIGKLHFTGFIKGFAEGVNYSVSFSIIQMLGFTLATKQPSATAPFINRQIKTSLKEGGQTILALLRTQFIAVVGNLSTVFPVCFLVTWAALKFQFPLFTYDESKYMFHANQLLGPSFVYACFTGILLFASSIFAGWFENFCTVTHLPKRIQYNKRINNWIGLEKSKKFADFIQHSGTAFAGNVSLGLILGLTPQIMIFLGIPLDVRHVTLATGTFAASLPMMIEYGVGIGTVADAVLGLLVIGICNISISFLCALALAAISSGTSTKTLRKLFKWGALQIFWKPWLLLIPESRSR